VNDERLVILIVDDSELIIEKMIGMIQDLDNIRIIFQAASYGEAFTIVTEVEPDIVLMDIVLHDKTGADLLKFIREKYQGSIETVVLTNHVGQHYRDICNRLGANYFLDKSSDFDLIPKMIRDKQAGASTIPEQRLPPNVAKYEVKKTE
jgi:DNA-binding NarL/FixJ family response regulator